MIKIALADDHEALRSGLAQLLKSYDMQVVAEAADGHELIEKLSAKPADIVLMDITMPGMDGIETTAWLQKNMVKTRVIAFSVMDNENYVIRMLKAGACAYLVKNAKVRDIVQAIREVNELGFHYSDLVTGKLVNNLKNGSHPLAAEILLSDKEKEFLTLNCSEKSYKEIADLMNQSPRTIEKWAAMLSEKLGLKSRVGLVLYAIKNHIVSV